MEKNTSLLGVLRTIFTWKRPILIISATATIGTVLISLLLPNFYQATTIFYAASPDLAKPEILFNRGSQLRSFYYGGENDIDRILTIGESAELLNFLVDSFDLYQHYHIDPNRPKAQYHVQEELLDLYELTKNKREALELSIEDKSPEQAAKMANAAREKINVFAQQLIKTNQQRTLKAYRDNIQIKQQELQVLGDSLAQLRARYEIYNIESQSELLADRSSSTKAALVRNERRLLVLKNTPGIPRDTIAYLSANVSGMREQVDSLEAQISRFRNGMSLVQQLEKQYLEANQTLAEDRERTKQMQATFQSDIPAVILVEKARVPIVKSRPRRSIIVIAAGLIAFVFSVLGVLLFDAYRQVDWRSIIKGD